VGGSLISYNDTVLAVGGIYSPFIHELRSDRGERLWVKRRERLPEERNGFLATLGPKQVVTLALEGDHL